MLLVTLAATSKANVEDMSINVNVKADFVPSLAIHIVMHLQHKNVIIISLTLQTDVKSK